MKRSMPWLGLALLASMAGLGCHKSSTGVTLTISPTTVTVLPNNTAQFVATVTGSTATVTWQVNSVAGGSTDTGTISTGGLYTAPNVVPTNPNVTITASVAGQTATATVTIQSGVQVTVTPTTFTIGTNESFPFVAAVTGIPANAITSTCNSVSPTPTLPACDTVTWSVTNGGSIGAQTGIFTAPSTAPTITIVVTATSVYDTNVAATAGVTIVAATDPTLISIGPNTGARGAVFQDVYLSGTNFISTTNVFINGVQVPTADLQVSSVTCATLMTTNTSGTSVPTPPCTSASLTAGSTVLAVRVPDIFLATSLTLPSSNSVSLTFTVARQNGTPQSCSPNAALCQLILSPVRPAVVGATPDSVPLGVGATFGFNMNGGYYGTALNPVVTAQFNGQPIFPIISGTNPDRQLTVNVQGSAASTPGLYQAGVISDTGGIPPAFSNLAMQPQFGSAPSAIGTLPVGTTPVSVAVDTGLGLAVVANQASNDIYLIDLTIPTPAVVAKICTASISATEPTCPTATPTSVAVDNLQHIALVTNSALNTIAVVDLVAKKVTTTLNLAAVTNNISISQVPFAVGINPVTGRAIVAYQGTNFGLLLDVSTLHTAACSIAEPQCVVGLVNISTGATPRIAVSPKLNWALVSPGGLGSLGIVNLSQQTTNAITSATRSNGTVTVITNTTHTLQVGEPVLITGFTGADVSFNGLATVVSVPSSKTFTFTQSSTIANAVTTGTTGIANYGLTVATVATNLTTTGVAVNDQTFKALLSDPGSNGAPATIFNMLDQSSASITTSNIPISGTIGAAFNPLTNIAITVNQTNNTGYLIDPTKPAILNTFAVGNTPWDVAIDPATDLAVVANKGDNTVSIVPLGASRSLQVLQVSTGVASSTPAGPAQIFTASSLTLPAAHADQPITVIGTGFTGSSNVRLDGTALATNLVNSRTLTATVPAALLSHAHLYMLDVSDSGAVSNASSFRVIQSISVSVSGCSTPAPFGVAIDAPNNVAVVSDSNCNAVYLVHTDTGLGQSVSVGTTPIGVAVAPQGGLAVVANASSNSISLVDDLNNNVTATIATESNPVGVAIDPILGQIAVTAAGSNDADIISISSTNGATFTPQAVQQGPVPVAIDPVRHIMAVGNQTSNTVSFLALVSGTTLPLQTISVSLPSGIVFDPISSDFLVSSAVGNNVVAVNPITQADTPVAVGINPTSLAYNFASSTLVTANSFGGNMTVVDMVDQRVREILPISSSGQFSIAIHPQTNLLVVADAANSRILFVPLP